MKSTTATAADLPLQGWRARLWAWVLFVALFKGLVPHAALASALMEASPALIWCAPGASSAVADVPSTSSMGLLAHACVCASASDGGVPLSRTAVSFPPVVQAQVALHRGDAPARTLGRLPPARGPPQV